MMSKLLAAATYRGDLGNGLIARWSTAEDTDNIAQLTGKVFRDKEAAHYTDTLKLDLYREGICLHFNQGNIMAIGPWSAPLYKSDADAWCPALVFLQLLFGYRSLDELRYAFPDVQAAGEPAILLNALFPKKYSWSCR
jgi:hypothetical protein